MTLTEDRLSEILDKKLEDFRKDLISSFAKDLLKEVNGLKSTINTVKTSANNALSKAKSFEGRIKALEEAEPSDVEELVSRISLLENADPCNLKEIESSVEHNATEIQSIKDDLAVMKATVEKCNVTMEVQEEKIEEMKNRQMRNTLVFKGIAESENEQTWDDVEYNLLKTIRKVIKDFPDDLIERCHRGYQKLYSPSGSRDIIARFFSWKDAEDVKRAFARKNSKDRNFGVYANQKYGPRTTARRNLAMVKRKELIASGDVAKAYVNYPAKLMVAKNMKDTEFKLHKNYSSHPITDDLRQNKESSGNQ